MLLLAAGALIGSLEASGLYRRAASLEAVCKLMIRLGEQLRYTQAPFSEIAQNILKTEECRSLHLSREEVAGSHSPEENWHAAIDKCAKANYFTDKDVQLLHELIKGLGKTDITGQLAHVEQYARAFDGQWQQAGQIAKEKGRMKITVWTAGAAVLVLLLM